MQTAIEVAQVNSSILADGVLQQRRLAIVGLTSGTERRAQRTFKPLSLELQPFTRGIQQVKLAQLAPDKLRHCLSRLAQQRTAVSAQRQPGEMSQQGFGILQRLRDVSEHHTPLTRIHTVAGHGAATGPGLGSGLAGLR